MERKLKFGLIVYAFSVLATHSIAAESVEIGSEEFGEAVREYLITNPEVIFEAVDIYNQRQEEAESAALKTAIESNRALLAQEDGAVVDGHTDGNLVIVEFVDYNCGYCRKAHADMAQILKSNSDVKLLVRQLPILSQDSLEAAKVVLAVKHTAGDEAALKLHNALYDEAQRADQATALSLAENQGLDPNKIITAIETQAVFDALGQSHQLAEALKIEGTPAFIVDDELLRGYVPAQSMQAIIDNKKG